MKVKAKKSLGQHFLRNKAIAERIASSLLFAGENTKASASEQRNVLEVGPGTGALTQFLIQREDINLKTVEIDRESVVYLSSNYPELSGRIINGDFLALELQGLFNDSFSVIGNFPYNISSQIFFKILDYKDLIPEVVCMLQKEVAVRLSSQAGSRDSGILSVLLQTWYNIEYLFTVDENQFVPPPKVKSAVIRLTRNSREDLPCNGELFRKIIKSAFNQRRKTIRNSLSGLIPDTETIQLPYKGMRAEQLDIEQFIEITKALEPIFHL